MEIKNDKIGQYLTSYKSLRKKRIKSLKRELKQSLTKNEIQRINNKKTLWVIGRITLYTVLAFYALISLLPFIWSMASSFRPQSEFDAGTQNFFPIDWTLDGYKFIWDPSNGVNIRLWLWNSIIICFFGTILNMVCNTLAGYSLSRLNYPGRDKIFWMLLAITMVPSQILLIPNYIIMTKLKLVGTFTSVVISSGVNIGYIFMTRQFFINFPREVEEAAEVDGISRVGSFFKIGLPLLIPILATQVVFTFTGYWNAFLTTNLYLGGDADKWPVTVGLFTIAGSNVMPVYNRILAASVISILPVLVLYVVLNNFFMKSYRMDGEK